MDPAVIEDFCGAYPAGKRHAIELLLASGELDRHLMFDDLEGDDEFREEYGCPYCYEEFDIGGLCSHLEEEHCFESRTVVCPICNGRVPRDLIGHITLQHGQQFRERSRRRFRSQGLSSGSTLSLLGKELRDARMATLLLGEGGGISSSSLRAESLVPGLAEGLRIAEEPATGKGSSSDGPLKDSARQLSMESTLSPEERQERWEAANLRAQFVQQLVYSTLLPKR